MDVQVYSHPMDIVFLWCQWICSLQLESSLVRSRGCPEHCFYQSVVKYLWLILVLVCYSSVWDLRICPYTLLSLGCKYNYSLKVTAEVKNQVEHVESGSLHWQPIVWDAREKPSLMDAQGTPTGIWLWICSFHPEWLLTVKLHRRVCENMLIRAVLSYWKQEPFKACPGWSTAWLWDRDSSSPEQTRANPAGGAGWPWQAAVRKGLQITKLLLSREMLYSTTISSFLWVWWGSCHMP